MPEPTQAELNEAAARVVDALEAVNNLASHTSAMDAVDTSVAGLGAFEPILTDSILAELKDRLTNERITADVLRAIVPALKTILTELLG